MQLPLFVQRLSEAQPAAVAPPSRRLGPEIVEEIFAHSGRGDVKPPHNPHPEKLTNKAV